MLLLGFPGKFCRLLKYPTFCVQTKQTSKLSGTCLSPAQTRMNEKKKENQNAVNCQLYYNLLKYISM